MRKLNSDDQEFVEFIERSKGKREADKCRELFLIQPSASLEQRLETFSLACALLEREVEKEPCFSLRPFFQFHVA